MALSALAAAVHGLPLSHPRVMALTDQVDLAYAMARTPTCESAELAALYETIRIRTNSVAGYLAAQEGIVPLVNAYLRATAGEGWLGAEAGERLLGQTEHLMRFKLRLVGEAPAAP